MKKRDLYLSRLLNFKDKPLIKVITGIRRCGKSTLLHLFCEHLRQNGINDSRIIQINFESFEFDEIEDYKTLHNYIYEKMNAPEGKYYIVLDEVQRVQSWEKVVNALLVDTDADIYITGSNAYLLSSELSTLLSGRYVEIKMFPLSFREYLDFTEFGQNDDRDLFFDKYLEYGSLPAIVELMESPDTIPPFLSGIYNTVLMKDVIERNRVRDAALLDSLLKFIAANIGNIVSTKKISDFLTSSGRKTTSDTIDNYLKMLESAYIIYRANRYDLKGKLFLKSLEKYYMVDNGIRNQLAGLRNRDFGHVLENIVYIELLRRDYEVTIGKIGPLEVDFVAVKRNKIEYFQVSVSIMNEETRKREVRSLQSISDNYPKFLLTMDRNIYDDFEGIRQKHIVDFLLEE
ncbi:MAG: ATP-binding protein [Calditrichaeota bacterium]|nr:MAG: ATP-binding protein [Calditrichota bacterium]